MKERSAINSELAAAQPPVRPQNKMVAEQAMLEIAQVSARNQAKIRQILLVFASPCGRSLLPCVRLDRDPAEIGLLSGATNKAIVADAKNGPQNAIAGRKRGPSS